MEKGWGCSPGRHWSIHNPPWCSRRLSTT